MDVSKLEVDMVIKNYKELCKLLNEDVKDGKSKVSQIKEFDRYFSYDRDGHKFIITELYSLVKPKVDGRSNGLYLINLPTEIKDLIVDTYGKSMSEITISERHDVRWKCSTCSNEFIRVPNRMKYDVAIKCNHCNQSAGSKLVYSTLLEYGLSFELEYKFSDLTHIRNLRFDYAVFKANKLITLIEYDGEYHNFHDAVIHNDKLKDEYCKLHSIPLLRVHHSNTDIVKSVSEYLLGLGLISNDMMTAYVSKVKLQELNKKLNKMITSREKLDNEINDIKNMINEMENAK